MIDDAISDAQRARQLLRGLGIKPASVGTGWKDDGAPLLVVDLPPDVDRADVVGRLADLSTEVMVRIVKRHIVAQGG